MNFRFGVVAAVLLLGVACVAQGSVYHVSASGSDANSGTSLGGSWQTLAKANATVGAGDVVIVHEGQYRDGIQPRSSGQPGSPISYQVASGEHAVLLTSIGIQLGASHSYIIVDGFEVHASYRMAELIGSSHITVRNCAFYGGRGNYSAFSLDGASYCLIQHNYLDRQDPDGASQVGDEPTGGDGLRLIGGSHHNLIEGNTVTRCEHIGVASSFSQVSVFQSFNIFRNNLSYKNHTNYSLQDGVQRTLFEGNTSYYPGLVWTGGNGWSLQFTGTNCILRFNTLYDDTGTVYTARQWPGVVGAMSGSINGNRPSLQFNKIYNNTVYAENDQKEWQKEAWRFDNHDSVLLQNDNFMKNNIVAGAPFVQVNDVDVSHSFAAMHNRYEGNLLAGASGQPARVRYESSTQIGIWSLDEIKRLKPGEWAASNLEGDPRFVNTIGQGPAKEFTLQSGSPAVDAGVHLTVARSGGSGATLQVDDAGYFTDGWGIPGVEGDSIRIEAGVPVGITSVDYTSNTLTLNGSRSWVQGARIFYYRSDRFQGSAPDIGSHELGMGVAPPPPSRPSPPTLFSPEDGAGHQNLDLTLRWSSVSTVVSFRVQVSQDANFTTPAIDVSTGDAFLNLSSLSAATTYYWRVNATNTAGTSDWSEIWSLTTVDPQNPPANVLSNPSFDNGLTSWWSYSNGQADLSVSSPGYNSAHAAKCHIAVAGDNMQLFQYEIPLTPNTKYTISFSAYSNSGHDLDISIGKHSSPYTNYGLSEMRYDLQTTWKTFTTEFTTSNFTSPVSDARLRFWFAPYAAAGDEYYIDNVVLTPATNGMTPLLVAPAPRAVDQPTDITLRWLKSAGASAYGVEVALDSGFTQKVAWDTAVADTQYHLSSLSALTTYYWHVNSRSASGTSAFSPVSAFTTGSAPLSVPVFTELPPGGEGLAPLEFTVAWSRVPGATRYHLQIAADASFNVLVLDDSTITETVRRLGPLQDGTTYYLRVRAENTIGHGPFSESVRFTTSAGVLAVPFIVASPGQSTNRPLLTSIRWQLVPGATHYHLQLSTDLEFKVLISNDSTLTDTVAQIGPLAYATTYFVRVRAMNNRTGSAFSLPYGFSTLSAAPPAPGGIVLGSQPQMTSVTLVWPATPGAINYHLQISRDSLFSTLLVSDTTLTDTIRTVTSLDASTRYFARVRAKGVGGIGAFGPTFAFSTAATPPSSSAPRDYLVEQNFPNPFNPSTKIRYGVPATVHVRIHLYNVLGQVVKTLVDADHPAGIYEVELTSGQLASGTYFYTFEAGDFVQTMRLLVLK